MTTCSVHDDNPGLLQLLTGDWEAPQRTIIQDSKWTKDYLTRLTGLSLDELVQEPTLLRSQKEQVKRDAQQLAYTDYPSFLHAETCRRELGSTLESLDHHFDTFLQSAPGLQQACEVFTSQAKEIVEERAKMTKVLEYQHVLMDLMELPQLMDTCVWNGYYSEAMDLAAHIRLLQVRYPLPVIRTIQEQVQASSDLMLIQLISHLRQPIKLAAAMNVTGYLRRMDAFQSETELRLVFLRCRHSYMEQRLEKIKKPTEDASATIVSSPTATSGMPTSTPPPVTVNSQETTDYLKRYVDVMREQMFEMATQYMSVFSSKEKDTLLADYMTHLVVRMQHTLNEHLRYIDDTSALASLLTQLQYCGMSLGRVGLDFRSLFVTYFEQAMQPLIFRLMDQATNLLSLDTLQVAVEDQTPPSSWLNVNAANQVMSSSLSSSTSSTSSSPVPVPPSSPSLSSLSSANNQQQRQQNPYQPPLLLVDYPCLAVFTNGMLTAFNALRLLPAIRSYPAMKQHLDACCLQVANSLKQYCDLVKTQFDKEEAIFVETFAAAYARCCVPYLQRCLVEGIYRYPADQLAIKDIEHLLQDYLTFTTETRRDENEDQGSGNHFKETSNDKVGEVNKEESPQDENVITDQSQDRLRTSKEQQSDEEDRPVRQVENTSLLEKLANDEVPSIVPISTSDDHDDNEKEEEENLSVDSIEAIKAGEVSTNTQQDSDTPSPEATE